jgi:hypothetical protein
MAQPQTARTSVWDLLRAEPSPVETALIQPASWSAFRHWEPATKRLPPQR